MSRGAPRAPCAPADPRGAACLADARGPGLRLLSKHDRFPSQEDPVLERYFKGHKAPVTAVHFSPNGKQLGEFYSLFSFCDGQALGRRSLARRPRWAPGEPPRRAGGAAGSPWAPSRRRAAPGPRLFAPEPPGGARGAGGLVGAGGRGAGGREFVKSCEAREEVRRGRSRRRRWPAVLGGPGKPGGGRGAEGPRERRVPVGSARPPEPRAQRRPAAPARRPGGRARARP